MTIRLPGACLDRFFHSEMTMAVHLDPSWSAPSAALRRWREACDALSTGPGDPGIEVDATRFAQAWRRHPHQGFPNYETQCRLFLERFVDFQQALVREGTLPPSVAECELSYSNPVTPAEQWARQGGLARLLSHRSTPPPESDFLPTPEGVVTATAFVMRDRDGRRLGRLTITVSSMAGERPKSTMGATLSARGDVRGATLRGVQEFFDTAFDWIVRGFASLGA